MAIRLDIPSRIWAAWVLQWCRAAGMRHLCLAPGSRSTPLVLAAEALGFEHHLHWDERALGFYALGLSRALGEPVGVVTTSGSAVANLVPAWVEAFQTGIPLIALTGDRPPELHHCGANQSIPQADLLATCTRARLTLPPFDPEEDPDSLRDRVATVLQALAEGPVHLNLMFREPFYPDADDHQALPSGYPVAPPAWQPSPPIRPPMPAALETWLQQDLPLWVVALDGCRDAVDDILKLAPHARLLADIQSGLHGHPGVYAGLDRLLADEQVQAGLEAPARVLQLGSRPVSKRLTQWLARRPAGTLGIIAPDAHPTCIGHNAAWHWRVPVASGVRALGPRIRTRKPDPLFVPPSRPAPPPARTSDWTEIEWLQAVQARLLERQAPVCWWVGNSLPIRLMDTFSLTRPAGGWDVRANRGASGIDGLIATLAGLARAEPDGPPVLALMGDLSALHDLTSLHLLARCTRPVTLVILNNDGGGIFRWLPVPDDPVIAARYRCAHGLDFGQATAMMDLPWMALEPGPDAVDLVCETLADPGTRVIELRTDADLSHARWQARIPYISN